MNEIVVQIMVKLLSTLALAAKELKQGQSSESVLADVLPFTHHSAVKSIKKTLRGGGRGGPPEAGPTHARRGSTTVSQTLEVVHGPVQNMRVVMDGGLTHSTCTLSLAEYPSL